MRKVTTWTLRAAGLLLPLLCAAGADAMPGGGDFCTEEQILRTVNGMTFDGEGTSVCHWSCNVTDQTRWTCWEQDRDPLQYSTAATRLEPIPNRADAPGVAPIPNRAAGRRLVPITAVPGALMCTLHVVSTGDASDTYTVPKEKPKGGESWCSEPDHSICCEGWYGACSY